MLPSEIEFERAYPAEGEEGSGFTNPRISKRWPGMYIGICPHCKANMMAEKRAPRCDACEDRRMAAAARKYPASEEERLRAEFDHQRIDRLARTMTALLERYIQVASYAYGALADPNKEPVVMAARAALEGAKQR